MLQLKNLFKNSLPTVLLIFPIFYLFYVFYGMDIRKEGYLYDDWRIVQLIIIASSFILSAASTRKIFFSFPPLTSNYFRIFIFIFAIGSFYSIYFACSPILAGMDLLLILCLIVYWEILLWAFKHSNKEFIHLLMAMTALFPAYIGFWFVVGHTLYVLNDVKLAWHWGFANIRYFDDTLLPCLFLLWYQPSFLKKYKGLVFFISTVYLLMLWVDAARAVWLGIAASFLLVLALYPSDKKQFLLPIVSILVSLMFYLFLLYLLPEKMNYTVMRGSSSGRLPMWDACIHYLLEGHVWGVGGANFIFYEKMNILRLGHIHNLVLQFLLEWGIAGFIFLLSLAYLYVKKILFQHKRVPPILMMSSLALLTNMMLSGAHVYPQSQMAMLILFVFLLSEKNSNDGTSTAAHTLISEQDKVNVLFLKVIRIILAFAMLFFVFWQLHGNNPLAREDDKGPRFWYKSSSAYVQRMQ